MMKHIKTDNCEIVAATDIFSVAFILSLPNLYSSCKLIERQGADIPLWRCDEHQLGDWWSFAWL